MRPAPGGVQARPTLREKATARRMNKRPGIPRAFEAVTAMEAAASRSRSVQATTARALPESARRIEADLKQSLVSHHGCTARVSVSLEPGRRGPETPSTRLSYTGRWCG